MLIQPKNFHFSDCQIPEIDIYIKENYVRRRKYRTVSSSPIANMTGLWRLQDVDTFFFLLAPYSILWIIDGLNTDFNGRVVWVYGEERKERKVHETGIKSHIEEVASMIKDSFNDPNE